MSEATILPVLPINIVLFIETTSGSPFFGHRSVFPCSLHTRMKLLLLVTIVVLSTVQRTESVPPKETARTGRERDANAFERGARGVSDWIDRVVGEGIARDVVHSAYHAGAGVARSGNSAEFKRAGQHLSNAGEKVGEKVEKVKECASNVVKKVKKLMD